MAPEPLPPYVRPEKGGTFLLQLWVQPGASRSGWAGIHGDRLKIRLGSPPVEGRANRELVRFLGKTLELPARDIELVAGASSRGKVVRLSGLTVKELLARLPQV